MLAIHIQAISVPRPYYAVQIQIDHFPLPVDISPKVRALLINLIRVASTDGLTSDVFLQNEYLANGKDQFNRHISEWSPESGLGVWPDRPPPELWKTSDVFRMARGQRVPLMYRVYRLKASSQASAQAFEIMLDSGMVIELLHQGSTEDLLKQYKDTYLPGIKEPNLRIFPFYVPLLDLNSLRNRKAEDLSRWLGGAHLYLRESPPDHAILIVADADLGPLLKQAGAATDAEGRWFVK